MCKPLVSAVMVTGKSRDRYRLASLAMEDFLRQTYQPRELLIINDGPVQLLDDPSRLDNDRGTLLRENPAAACAAIREPRLNPSTGRERVSLGELRNMGLDMAAGEFVCQWDDDDHHHPLRLEQQMTALLTHGKEICCLTHQIRYGIPNDAAFVAHLPIGIPGTVLHKKTARRYPKLGKHEDSHFFKAYEPHERLLISNGPDTFPGPALYVRTYSTLNTFGPLHIMGRAKDWQNHWRLPTKELEVYLRSVAGRYEDFKNSLVCQSVSQS